MFRDTYLPHFFHPGRHGGGGRHGGFGRGRSFWGGGDDNGMPGGRRFTAADLQLLLLALLEQQPAHGYELIRLLEERSGGFYAPSPGMVYPALTYLDELGHAAHSPDGNRKLYTLTAAGRAHLDAHRDDATRMLEMLTRIGSRMEGVREAYAGLGDIDPDASDTLHKARHGLKAALIRSRGASPDAMRRIAAILDRATAEILAQSEGRTGSPTGSGKSS